MTAQALMQTCDVTCTGVEVEHAANLAILDAPFQVLETFCIRSKSAGHLTLTAVTQAGANVLKQMPFIQFGIQNKFTVHLFPDTVADQTWQHSIVSSHINQASSFTAAGMLQYLQSLVDLALNMGRRMAAKGYIQTPQDRVGVYFFDSNGQAVDGSAIDMTTIADICFAPRGHCMEYMPEGLIKAKAASQGGLALMLKLAEKLSGILLLYAASQKRQAVKLAGKPLLFTTGHKSIPGDSLGKRNHSIASTTVAALCMAREKKPSAADIQHMYATDVELKFLLEQAWKKLPVQAIPQTQREVDTSPDIIGDLLGDFGEDSGKRNKRGRGESEVIAITCAFPRQHCRVASLLYDHDLRLTSDHWLTTARAALRPAMTLHYHQQARSAHAQSAMTFYLWQEPDAAPHKQLLVHDHALLLPIQKLPCQDINTTLGQLSLLTMHAMVLSADAHMHRMTAPQRGIWPQQWPGLRTQCSISTRLHRVLFMGLGFR